MIIGPRENWPFKVIEEQAVTQLIEAARSQYPRFDEAWDGIVWLIAHGGHKMGSPYKFGNVGHILYVDEGDRVVGFPRILVVYRYTLEAFVIKLIRVSSPSAI
jgi:hypothetical protein